MALQHVCLPVNLDAFVLNEEACNATGLSLVAPITQPKYVSIRLSNNQAQHDILPEVDLHNASKAATNPRISSVLSDSFRSAKDDPEPTTQGTASINRQRLGIYLHWTVPRGFRNATSQADPPPPIKGDDVPQKADTNPQPVFPPVPNRWLVVRTIHDNSWSPPEARPDKVSAWVIESDRLRKLEELDKDENGQPIDLETDVAPFTAYDGSKAADDPDLLNAQANIFLGNKTPIATWREQKLRRDQRPNNAAGTGAKFINLTIMNSSNPLFADYVSHNGNVFSLKDNLYYGNGNYLTSATCDYAIFGWHSDYADDPLWASNTVELGSKLQNQFCTVPGAERPDYDPTKDSTRHKTDRTRLICHAAKFNVVFSPRKANSSKADKFAENFTKGVDMEPVAVGTTPLDAMLAFFQAHAGEHDPELNSLFANGSKTASTLMDLRELFYATEDDYDSRVKAADLVFAHNFGRNQGGFQWHYAKKKDSDQHSAQPPAEPSDKRPVSTSSNPLDKLSEKELIAEINNAQRILDSTSAKADLLRWSLFSEWFKYVSDPHGDLNKSLYAPRVPLLRNELSTLIKLMTSKEKYIVSIQSRVQVKKVAFDPFFKRTDPTLCIAGLDAGWDPEFLSGTPTRYADGLSSSSTSQLNVEPIKSLLRDATRFSADRQPNAELTALSTTLNRLLDEFSRGYKSSLDQFAFKKWDGQPFRPQYVEWKGIYHHIPYTKENWEVKLTNSALASTNHKQIMYATRKKLSDIPEILTDTRAVSGRMLILPQPSFTLGAVVAQVLSATSNDRLPQSLWKKEDKDNLVKAAASMPFVSGELSGLSDALLTLVKGQHVKPNLRIQGKGIQPMAPAVTAGSKIGMQNLDFINMAGESGSTPYGTLARFPDSGPSPFKAVQHGQFAITGLVVVDKFGQAIACPLPKRQPRPGAPTATAVPEFIHPCLSEQLMPTLLDGNLNTVYTTTQTHDAMTESNVPMTPFMQLNPSINQEARLNATFLVPGANQASWRSASDWENPIFGWVIVNYADEALQFFTSDGTYYTSIQFGGPRGTVTALKWLPFDAPPAAEAASKVSPQLTALIAQMTNPKNPPKPQDSNRGERYLKAFWETIRAAIPSMPFPPSDYAAYANAIVGKPLALVNAGWSLELAQPAYWPQHTLPPPRNPAATDTIDPLRKDAMDAMKKYSFNLKIGDAERSFDGVVVYWDIDSNFNNFYAYKTLDGSEDLVSIIEPSNFPPISPYYLDPPTFAADLSENPTPSTAFVEQHAKQLLVKSLLIDPYTPLHVWSGILPISTLKLPGWTIQNALKNMTAFFAVGPILITKDVPAVYDPSRPLTASSWQDMQNQVAGDSKAPTVASAPVPAVPLSAAQPGDASIKLPIAGGKGLWNWLQPYIDQGATKYNALAVTADDGAITKDPAPYTLVEGFLQLARPLVQPVIPDDPGK